MTKSSSGSKERRLVPLIDELIAGSISEEDFQKLTQAVSENPDALAVYVDYLNIHSALRQNFHSHSIAGEQRLELQIADDNKSSLPHDSTLANKNRWIFYLATIAATLLVCCAALMYRSLPGMKEEPKVTAVVTPNRDSEVELIEGVAVLTRMVDVEWEDGASDATVGSPLPRQELKIKSGLLLVEFYCGAAVIIEGPAAFDLVAPDRGFAHYGKLRAHVPARARGFTIGTKSGKVVDLGTEFGLDISQDGQSEVHVIDGEVDFHDIAQADGIPHRLVGGQGIELALNGESHRIIRSDATRFVGHEQFSARADEQHEGKYRQWLDYHAKLRNDPALVADYLFDDSEGWGRTLVNGAPGASELSDGAIVGAGWQRGRWPQSKALGFGSPSDRVRIKLDGEFESLTLATWVNITELAGKRSIALLHPEIKSDRTASEKKQRFIHWTINSAPSGLGALLHFAESHGNRKVDRNHYSSVTQGVRSSDLGNWVHLSMVYDSEALKVSHYRNGVLVRAVDIESPRRLEIGVADLCNWPYKEWAANTQFEFRNLNGLMDEFVVLGRALSSDEIREMHAVGQP